MRHIRPAHRYNDDGYGEHEDGAPFDGTGIGRAWPLLTGERGHLDILLGIDPLPYLEMMAHMTGLGRLIPEQMWDVAPITARKLEPGKPSGSAIPLVWAHAEFLKLLAARQLGRPLEMPASVERRYKARRPVASVWHWRHSEPFGQLPFGRALLIESPDPFHLHYGFDDWRDVAYRPSEPQGWVCMESVLMQMHSRTIHGWILRFTFLIECHGKEQIITSISEIKVARLLTRECVELINLDSAAYLNSYGHPISIIGMK